jgi:hypothetical protein
MAVRAQTQVRNVKHWRRSCDLAQGQGVLNSCGLQVSRFYRHGVDLLRAQRRILQEALSQVGKVPIGMSGGGHTLVDLKYMHTLPGDIFLSECPQHDPRSVTATDS